MNKVIFLALMTFVSNLSAFEDSALWLPTSYQNLAPELRQAAKKMELKESCEKVLRGYLHDSSHSIDDATFMIVCRSPDRKTHSVLVNAQSLEVHYPIAVEAPAEPERDLEAELKARIEVVWKACEAQYQKKTRFMRNLITLTEGRPDPVVDEDGTISFSVDFDAESLQGAALKYRAPCRSVDDETPPKLSILARKP